MVGAEHAQPADQHSHFGRTQPQQLGTIDQQFFGWHVELDLEIVAETIGLGLQRIEACRVGLLGGRIGTARRERHVHIMSRIARSLFDRCRAAQHDQIGEADLLAAARRAVEIGLNTFQHP